MKIFMDKMDFVSKFLKQTNHATHNYENCSHTRTHPSWVTVGTGRKRPLRMPPLLATLPELVTCFAVAQFYVFYKKKENAYVPVSFVQYRTIDFSALVIL